MQAIRELTQPTSATKQRRQEETVVFFESLTYDLICLAISLIFEFVLWSHSGLLVFILTDFLLPYFIRTEKDPDEDKLL